jgi:hypothetical protein
VTKVEFEPAGKICYIGWELLTVVIEQVSRCRSRDATPRQTVVVLGLANDLMVHCCLPLWAFGQVVAAIPVHTRLLYSAFSM